MKTSSLVFVTLLTLAPVLTSMAQAAEHSGSAFEIAQSYVHGGRFGGPTSGTTGSALDLARDSLSFPGSLGRVASTWTPGRIMAKGG